MEPQSEPPLASWKGRRVLVTGADGFVGRWLVPALAAKGAHVCALVRAGSTSEDHPRSRTPKAGIEFAEGEITDLADMSRLIAHGAIDTVYHLAAINTNTGAGVSPYQVFETNIRGVYTVLEACRTAAKPVSAIISSSKEVEDCFLPESTRPHHPYMTSKAAAELIAHAYHDTFGVPTVLVRSDNLYGGGDFNWNRLIPGTIRSVLNGERPVIRSNGMFRRDYVYIEDAVAAYLAVGERVNDPKIKGQLFRIASGHSTSVLDVVKEIISTNGGARLEPEVLNEQSEARVDTIYTPELEKNVLGWSAQFPLVKGLRRTVEWYRDFAPK